MTNYKINIEDAEEALSKTTQPFIQLMQHGSMQVEYYKPDTIDLQMPHKQDELYVVISGAGNFKRAEETIAFKPHDVLFVPAGMAHRFENFTDDFATWVIFYGVNGGEK